MTYYAAYGTNLDPTRMAELAPYSPCQGTGWIQGWRLTFGGNDQGADGALPTLVEDKQCQTFVALYDLTKADQASLDQFEGVPIGLYRKIHVRVATLDGEVTAWIYVLLDAYEGGTPTAFSLGKLADAVEAAGAPDDYVHQIRCMPSRATDDPE